MRLKGTTVLLVEDDIDNLELLATYLEGVGARVLSAESVQRALELTAGQPFDVMITDVELPDGDGWGLLQELQQRLGRASIPAMAISGYSREACRALIAESAFLHFAVKPLEVHALVDWVEKVSPKQTDASLAPLPGSPGDA